MEYTENVTWNQSPATDKFIHYSFNPADVEGGAKRIHPKNFPEGSGMKRVVAPSDKSCRAGFTKLGPGKKIRPWFFWYKELWHIVSGTGEVKVHDKRTGDKQTVQFKPGDLLYYPEGVLVDVANTGKEDLTFLYVAVPASHFYASWLPFMEPEDLEAVKRREGD